MMAAVAMTAILGGCGGGNAKETGTTAGGAKTEAAAEETKAEAAAEGAKTEAKGVKVALITMDQMDVHWVRLHDAAEARVNELNKEGNAIELSWLAPEVKDSAEEIKKIEAAIADNVDYIIIACSDATSCNMALQEALNAGIKIIYIDSPATLEGSATFATDNYHGGVLAGEYLLNKLNEAGLTEGNIGIVDAQPGADATQKRYDGFASVFENTNFVLGERQYSDGDSHKAQELANTLINNGVIALYGTNEGSTGGMASAVADASKNGTQIYCVGWDKSDSNISHVEGGELLAFMAQKPDVMGQEAINAVVAMEQGEDLGGKVVDTGISTIDASNVADFK